ncbi:DedA family protein [Paenibacillus contaminans]|uniref:DedA family protein n=1 Tax=Paenibacillus contaminans TaxID=450362 RepID=A0A329M8M1_9BACL|nr:DedA family protein [Paenibacillus contaminans]RAV16098.1 DedA family protein [Paenibacillus contaminans]
MNYEWLLSLLEQFGYAALFFALWLGIVGMPIPDEVIVMTGGAVTVNALLHPIPAFVLTYLGVVSGLSLGYVLGRYLGTPVLTRLRRKKKMEKYLHFSETLVQKYGSFAIGISYFFPIVRHVMPYVVGVHNMSFKRYALFSYTTGLVWTFLFFTVGRYAGNHVEEIGMLLYEYGLRLLWLPFVLFAVWAIIRYSYKDKRLRRS